MMMTTTTAMIMTVTWHGRAPKVQHMPSSFIFLFLSLFSVSLFLRVLSSVWNSYWPWTCRHANEERQRRSFAHDGQPRRRLTSRAAGIWCWRTKAKGATDTMKKLFSLSPSSRRRERKSVHVYVLEALDLLRPELIITLNRFAVNRWNRDITKWRNGRNRI